jgi:hypothetical protein
MMIEVLESELQAAGWTPEVFGQLPVNERRWVVSGILRRRLDAKSQFAASMMERANPNFTQFSVVVGQ